MKITALVENQSAGQLKPKHGLSLYIETARHKILFDVGPDDRVLFENSKYLGIGLSEIDTVIISHGHVDHTGALEKFLRVNNTAKVYIQRKAFEKHYIKLLFLKINVGVSAALREHPRMVLLDGDYTIDDELTLFTVPDTGKCRSSANDVLLTGDGKDDFAHEQNLIVRGNGNALIMGCGHAGVVNVLEKAAKFAPKICAGGYHLYNPVTKKHVPEELLENISRELAKHKIDYYTCHCTGKKAFDYFSGRLPNMKYLSCGESITL